MDYEKLERDLNQLRLPENLPKLSFDPDREPAPKTALRNNLLAAAAGVTSIAMVFGAIAWSVRWHNEFDPSIVPSQSAGPSVPDFSLDPSVNESEIPSEETPLAPPSSMLKTASRVESESVGETILSIPNESSQPESDVKPLPDSAQIIELPEGLSYQFFWNDWLYCRIHTSSADEDDYCRISLDGIQKQTFDIPFSSEGYPVAFEDDWIYFSDGYRHPEPTESVETLYRIRPDGSERMEYQETFGAEKPVLFHNWLYFVSRKVLYRISTDGTEKQELLHIGGNFSYQVYEDGIFFAAEYSDAGYENRIIHCGLDGSNPTVLRHEPKGGLDLLAVNGNYLYFRKYLTVDGLNVRTLCRMRLDGTEYQTLTQQDCWSFEIKDDWIYYASHDSLGRMRLDGSENQVLVDKGIDGKITVCDSGIYFTKDRKPGEIQFCRISFEGSDLTQLYHKKRGEPYHYSGHFVVDDIPYVVLIPNSY